MRSCGIEACDDCPFEDCIVEDMTPEEYARARELDREIGLANKPNQDRRRAAKKRAYREANKDEIAAKRRAYREANKDELAAKRRARKKENPA